MPAITVPRLGWSMEEGTFVEWLKADGDTVSVGEPLFVLESEKSTETVEAIDAGVLRIRADAPRGGETVKVGQVLGYVGESSLPLGERVPEADESMAILQVPLAQLQRRIQHELDTDRAEGRRNASPRARRIASELGLDWRTLSGSGRNGRVRERDVRGVASEGRLIPHTGTRKIIAARMVAGVTQAAPVTLTARANVKDIVAMRALDSRVPGYTALLIRAAALALRDHPDLRSQWRDDGLFVPERIHIAFAVDTDAGLFAPVVRDADRCDIVAISRQVRDLAAQARAGTLPVEDTRGAVFTVSNLGMFGVEAFTPIINLPQCATLGAGRIVDELAVERNAILVRQLMTLSLTFDHRVTDGAPAARFLDSLRALLERPDPLFSPNERRDP